mmetsp:Transcript_33611/g.79263  ORF Transcript_33611/g.79263 Transcript_33611/m.79263 type:complete len:109 (-) Transcript_33611:1365-1691(-)
MNGRTITWRACSAPIANDGCSSCSTSSCANLEEAIAVSDTTTTIFSRTQRRNEAWITKDHFKRHAYRYSKAMDRLHRTVTIILNISFVFEQSNEVNNVGDVHPFQWLK